MQCVSFYDLFVHSTVQYSKLRLDYLEYFVAWLIPVVGFADIVYLPEEYGHALEVDDHKEIDFSRYGIRLGTAPSFYQVWQLSG